MMAAQKSAVAPPAVSTSAGLHLYRKFKRSIALEKPVVGVASGCGVAAKASADCKC